MSGPIGEAEIRAAARDLGAERIIETVRLATGSPVDPDLIAAIGRLTGETYDPGPAPGPGRSRTP